MGTRDMVEMVNGVTFTALAMRVRNYTMNAITKMVPVATWFGGTVGLGLVGIVKAGISMLMHCMRMREEGLRIGARRLGRGRVCKRKLGIKGRTRVEKHTC